MERLAESGIEVQEQLWAVLAEDEAMKGTDTPKPLRAEVKHILWQVLTLEAWEAIAQATSQSIHHHVIEQMQTPKVE
jgi:flagellar biosynthesis regulator FlaF